MTLEETLEGVSSILLDSAPVIDHLERHPVYVRITRAFFRLRARRNVRVVTSPVTLTECLVQPVLRGADDLAAEYAILLLKGKDTVFHPIGAEESFEAARVRAYHNLLLADACQVAVARLAGCEAILTNDTDFRRVDHPRAIILDDFVGDEES